MKTQWFFHWTLLALSRPTPFPISAGSAGLLSHLPSPPLPCVVRLFTHKLYRCDGRTHCHLRSCCCPVDNLLAVSVWVLLTSPLLKFTPLSPTRSLAVAQHIVAAPVERNQSNLANIVIDLPSAFLFFIAFGLLSLSVCLPTILSACCSYQRRVD